MANKKISDLTALTGADSATDDEFVVVDTSAEAGEGETKRITRAELIEAVAQNFVTVTASGTITAGGNVGIGTDNPSVKLDVKKTSGTGYAAYIVSTINVDGSDNGLFIGGYDEHSGSKLLTVQSNTITPGSGAYHERFVVQADGKVGIGTSSPEQELSVSGQINTFGGSADGNANGQGILINNTGWGSNSGLWKIVSGNSTNSLNFYANTASSGNFSTNNIPLTLLQGGNVGIGTSNPLYKLDISGTTNTVGVRVSSNTVNDNLYYGTGTVTGNMSFFGSNISATGNLSGTVQNTNTSVGNAVLSTNVPASSSGDPYLDLTINGAVNWTVGVDNSDSDKFKIGPNSSPSNGTASLTIDTSGKVGIGTDDPGAKTTIYSSVDNSAVNIRTDSTGLDIVNSKETVNAYSLIRMSGWGLSADAGANDGRYIQTIANGNNDIDMVFGQYLSTSAITEHMRIDGSGNVSIPTGNLAVSKLGTSEVKVTNSSIGKSGVIRAMTSTGDIEVGGLNGSQDLKLLTGGTPRMTIDNSGHVIIGRTSTLGYKLDVLGDINFERTGTSSQVMVRIANGNGTVGSITTSGSSTAFNTSSDYRLKEDIQPMVGATERVLALNPINFAWKVDGSRVDGFLAHEAQEVVPECISGTKDEMRDEEYEVSAALGEVFTPAIDGIDEVTETVVVTQAIEAQDAVMGEFQVTETVETGTYVNLAGVTITETREVGVTEEATETVVERQDIDGISTEVEVERTVQVAVMEAYEVSPAIEAVAEVTEVNVITESVDAVAEVIISADVERPTELTDQQQWRETAEQVMDTRSVPDMQGIDQSKIVPLLVAALQEALARIESLEA